MIGSLYWSNVRNAKLELAKATPLAAKWQKGTLTYDNSQTWQFNLLHAYWNGSLQRRVRELTANCSHSCQSILASKVKLVTPLNYSQVSFRLSTGHP